MHHATSDGETLRLAVFWKFYDFQIAYNFLKYLQSLPTNKRYLVHQEEIYLLMIDEKSAFFVHFSGWSNLTIWAEFDHRIFSESVLVDQFDRVRPWSNLEVAKSSLL